MSPRAAPTRDDATAHHFLSAAASLIDSAFSPSAERGRHPANAMHFPAALDWLRVEDVIRRAQQDGDAAASRKAFHNRWKDKDSFLRDAVIHALLYEDDSSADPNPYAGKLGRLTLGHSASAAIIEFSDALLDSLMAHPRSFLLLHLAPLLDQHNEMYRTVLDRITLSREPWYEGYRELLAGWALAFRPGWTVERFDLTLQAMLDGFLLRFRIQPDFVKRCGWQGASLFADSVVGFTLGVTDASETQLTSREALDDSIESATHHRRRA